MRKILFAFIFVFISSNILHAEIIQLVTGETIECNITKREGSFIRVFCDEGIPSREYLLSQVSSITMDGATEHINGLINMPKKMVNTYAPEKKTDTVVIDNNTINDMLGHQKIITEENIIDNTAAGIKKENGIITIVGDLSAKKLKDRINDFFKAKERELRADLRRKRIDFNEAKKTFILYVSYAALFIYLLTSLPIFILARKLSAGLSFLAWIPFINLFLLCRMAGISCGWLIIVLIPGINIIFLIMFSCILWWLISKRCQRPGWLGLFMIFPVISLIIPFYLAISYAPERGGDEDDDIDHKKSAAHKSKKASESGSSEEMKKRILGDAYVKGKAQRL